MTVLFIHFTLNNQREGSQSNRVILISEVLISILLIVVCRFKSAAFGITLLYSFAISAFGYNLNLCLGWLSQSFLGGYYRYNLKVAHQATHRSILLTHAIIAIDSPNSNLYLLLTY